MVFSKSKRRGRKPLSVSNCLLRAAIQGGRVPRCSIRSACLEATGGAFSVGTGESWETVQTLLETLEAISTETIEAHGFTKRYSRRLAKACREAHKKLIQFI